MTTRHLTDPERRDWLRLIRSENVGPITFFHLLRRFGSAAAALEALPELSRRGGRTRPLVGFSKAKAEEELATLEKVGARLVAHGEPDYPKALAAIEDAPPVLAVRGHAHLLTKHAVAIVGARNASANGIRFARQLAADLGRGDLVVVSGLARGIDAAAHLGALESGTVAVMAGGVDVVYPSENRTLYDGITAAGAIVSEIAAGTAPTATHFPRRNRIISGLSLGVVVVEAARRSGSLITARFGLEQGREVFAVPGSPLDPRSQGCNHLLRQGATLVEGAEDVLAGLSGALRTPLAEPPSIWDQFGGKAGVPADDSAIARARPAVVEKLGPTPTPVDEIIRQCQLSPAIVLTVLLELELAGRLVRHPGNLVSLQS
jgi:DNA processing protein